MASRGLGLLLLGLGGGGSIVACTIGGPTYETITLPMKSKDVSLVCGSAFASPDLSTLTPCGGGAGHCYPSSKVALPELPACEAPGDVCVPDAVFRADGKPLKTCTFFIGDKPGACVSTMVKQIGQNQDQLKSDVCDEGERCAPCISPIDGTDTHLCEPMGVHGEACEAGASAATPEACCHSAGVCMNRDGVPEGSRDQMSAESCPSGKLCAPAALANGTPVKCDVLGVGGVCLDLCFAAMLKGAAVVTRGGCGPTELCLPCIIGKTQGMPGCN